MRKILTREVAVKTRGFTLIELLVVIIILGIISVLVVPNVIKLYQKARIESFKTSVKSIAKSVDNYVFYNGEIPESGINVSELDITNKNSYSGKFVKNENGRIEADNISNGVYCASGELENLYVEKGCENLDTTAPTNLMIIVTNKTSGSLTIVGDATDPESGITKYEFKIDSSSYIDKGNTNTHTFSGLTQGNHTIYMRVTNGKGMTSEEHIEVTLESLSEPTYSISPSGWSTTKTVTINYPEGNDLIYTYSIDEGETWIPVSNGTTVDVVFNTNGTLIGRVSDGDNTVTSSQMISQIDTTAPTLSFETNGNNTYAKTQSTKVTVNDNSGLLGELKYIWTTSTTEPEDVSFTQTFTNGTTINSTSGVTGEYYLWIKALDSVGNETVLKSNVFKLDNTPPVVTSVASGTSNISYSGFTMTRSGNASDGESGLAANPYTYQTSTNGTTWTTKCTNNTTTCDVTGLNPSTAYYYRICVVDTVGNQSCVASKSATTLSGVFNYAYTGTVQSFTAPVAGKYKLEVWGAEGTVYSNGGSYYSAGKGAYAKGEITLEVGITLYVYVGGQTPFNYSGYVFINGGWNGGGGVCATCEEDDWKGNTHYSVKAPGGGATDVSFVNSNVTYNNYRTVRSDASLLSRVIVAGGGAGSSNDAGTEVDANFIYGYGGALEGAYYIAAYGATQTTPGLGGGFGFGANATAHTQVYCSSAGGGGWYGGGGGFSSSNKLDSANVNYIGGSSSFVWNSSSAANVPSGYSVAMKYYLSNTVMTAGNASMPIPAGGTQTGHSGSGYARITFVSAS